MTKDQCRAAIVREYDRWIATEKDLPKDTLNRVLKFHTLHLELKRPDLLSWHAKHGDDRWQDVKMWIKRHAGG